MDDNEAVAASFATMSNKEKLLAGLTHDARDPALLAELMRSRELYYAINNCPPRDEDRKQRLLDELFGEHYEGLGVVPPIFTDYGYKISFGKNCFVNCNNVFLDENYIKFGDYVLIGPHCTFSTVGHPLDTESRNKWMEYAYPITVGDSVWFGAGVTVLPGVTIGSNTVIGAGSIVTKDIPSGVIALGNPCRVLRKITPEDSKRYGMKVWK